MVVCDDSVSFFFFSFFPFLMYITLSDGIESLFPMTIIVAVASLSLSGCREEETGVLKNDYLLLLIL